MSQNISWPENQEYKRAFRTRLLLSQNKQTTVERRRSRRARRKQTRKKPKDFIRPEYESCKNQDISSLALKKERSSKITEGGFCFTCFGQDFFGSKEINETAKALQSKTFKEKLQKRVIGQIESKLFQTRSLRACITKDRGWFSQKKIDWPLIKKSCEKKNKALKYSIKYRWPEMRVQLSLSRLPLSNDQRVLYAPKSVWIDKSPSHLITSFKETSLPHLTRQERRKAEQIYIKALSETPLEHVTQTEFKRKLIRGNMTPAHFWNQEKLDQGAALHSTISTKEDEKHISARDHVRLSRTARKLSEKAKSAYFQILQEAPVLGYIQSGKPGDRELGEAFSEIEEKLADFLEEAKDPSADMGLLLSFKPLVEEILREDQGYCLAAEEARIEAEKDESLKNWLMIGAGALAAIPCFISGPIGASACLAGGMGLGIWGYTEANIARKEAFGRALTGKQFETIASLKAREKEELLAKLFLPLGAYGTTAVPARAASKAIAKTAKKLKSGKEPPSTGQASNHSGKSNLVEPPVRGANLAPSTGIESYQETLGRLARSSLKTDNLSPQQMKALQSYHSVVRGQKGKDGTPARVGNYTASQIRKIVRFLEKEFSPEQVKTLIEDSELYSNHHFRKYSAGHRLFHKRLLRNIERLPPEGRKKAEAVYFYMTHEQSLLNLSDPDFTPGQMKKKVIQGIKKDRSGVFKLPEDPAKQDQYLKDLADTFMDVYNQTQQHL